MTTNLYQVLGISPNATPEQVRKAYRKKALETHPDRLPQGASAAEKAASEDLFRKVNNAYEVLSDPQSRSSYDQHGVWPPPAPAPQAPFANGHHDPFSGPFFRDPFVRGPRMDPFGGFGFGPRPGPRGFTDPFVLFDSIFGDLHRAFEMDPFFDDPYGRRGVGPNHPGVGFFGSPFHSMLPSPFDFSGGGMGGSRMQAYSNGGNGGRWIAQSWTSSTVNGVTHAKGVRRDSEGNEHVMYQYPDGTERRTVNGVDQSGSQPQRALPSNAVPVADRTRQDGVPPPSYYEAVGQPHRSRSSGHHSHYYDDRRQPKDRHRHEHGKERDRAREYETDAHGYHDGRDAHGSSSWKIWK